MNQRTPLRNEFEYSPKPFWGEYSNKGVSGQYLRSSLHPIYHADRPGLCRVVLRLWRELVFPFTGYEYAISYQDEQLHTGKHIPL